MHIDMSVYVSSKELKLTCFLLLSSVPTGPPVGVIATPVNSTSVFISWDPPQLEFQNGVITGYSIILTTVMVDSRSASFFSSNTGNITIRPLHPFTAHVIAVAAQNSVGTGPYTSNYSTMTPEDGKSCFYCEVTV